MKTKESNTITLEQFNYKHYGKLGATKRDELEAGYENFEIGAMIRSYRKFSVA